MDLADKLDFYCKHNQNVLLIGKHGVGKSSVLIQALLRAKVKFKYFSAATMDPWVDFLGIPKEVQTKNGSYLELIRPLEFQDDGIEVLVFDEFNRAPKKVRNAAMEIIQFKSINGKPFKNLRMIWAAINPDDDQEYDVEKLDLAQQDRFQVQIEVPYKLDSEYFTNKYGSDTTKAVTEWWEELDEIMKKKVSPRRVDYALEIHGLGGSLRDVLPNQSNISKLTSLLTTGSVVEKLISFLDKPVEARDFLLKENNYNSCIDLICSKNKYISFFLPLMPEEKQASLILEKKEIARYVAKNPLLFENVLFSLHKTSIDDKIRKLTSNLIKQKILDNSLIVPIWSAGKTELDNLKAVSFSSAANKKLAYLLLEANFPSVFSLDLYNLVVDLCQKLVASVSIKSFIKMPNLGKMLNALYIVSIKQNYKFVKINPYRLNQLRTVFPEVVF